MLGLANSVKIAQVKWHR